MLRLKDPESVLIVSNTDRALEFIAKQLDSALYSPLDSAKSGTVKPEENCFHKIMIL